MADIYPYPQHGGQLHSIAERFGIPASELLDFSANINPDGPPAAVTGALRAAVQNISAIARYPDLELRELKNAIANHAAISSESIIVANGFVPLLETVLRTLRVVRCLLAVPSFIEYRRTLERVGSIIDLYKASHNNLFRYDLDALLGSQCDAILLANPQNPSGICQTRSMIPTLVEETNRKGIYILVDEAFIDYVPQQSLLPLTQTYRNLIVFRSVTKFYAIPGLRVAYAAADPEIAAMVTRNIAPWPVTTLAASAVIAALGDDNYAERARIQNELRRSRLQNQLSLLDLLVYPGDANFLLFQLPQAIDPDRFWRLMVSGHRVVLRSCANYDGLSEAHFRVAVKTSPENDALVAAIADSIFSLRSLSYGSDPSLPFQLTP